MNPDVIKQLKETIEMLTSMKKGKCLEVACGPAYVTSEILYDKFSEIHMFDHDQRAIDVVKDKFKDMPKVSSMTVRTM